MTRDRMGDSMGDKRRETGQGHRTVVQETVDFVLRWDWEAGDRRLGIEDWRRETGDGRQETGDERQETRDRRWETGDRE